MRFKNLSPFAFGYKACSRKPPQVEAVIIVRAKYQLSPGEPLRLAKSTRVAEEDIGAMAQTQEVEEDANRALLILGQGFLNADRFHDDDSRQQGEVLQPGDFADFKLSAEVMLRGSCHLGRPAAQADVELSVGAWSKKLRVMGVRVLLDRVAGGKATDPQGFSEMPIDYAHAYGGPGFANNPVGKGHLEASAAEIEEELFQPPRSERSRVMAADQLPNVLYADGATHKGGLPAGYGPLNATWPCRADRAGKAYDAAWRATRAPWFAEDFDYAYFYSAPPDQRLAGFLAGDERVRLRNLHRDKRDVAFDLPAERVRAFVIEGPAVEKRPPGPRKAAETPDFSAAKVREIGMSLDTLYIDAGESAVYLTWRGHTKARDAELSDLPFALIASEAMHATPRPAAEYAEMLRAHASDPIGLRDQLPEGLEETAAAAARLDDASDEEIERMLEAEGEDNPISALLANLGPLTGGARDLTREPLSQATANIPPEELKSKVKEAVIAGRGSGKPQSPEAAKQTIRRFEDQVDRIRDDVGTSPEIDALKAQLAEQTNGAGMAKSGEEPADAASGVSYAAQDLTGKDFSGKDLSGANFESAVLDRADFSGARLVGANMKGAQLHKTILTKADLSQADLSFATLDRVEAAGAQFRGAKLEMTQLRQVNLAGACLAEAAGVMTMISRSRLDDVDARGIVLDQAGFDETDLSRADMSQAKLKATRFRACQAASLKLEGAELDNSGFKDSDLSGANVRRARGELSVWLDSNLSRADFAQSRLPQALFGGAHAERAVFYGADLQGSRFDAAMLERATFQKANLHGASLRKANIGKASFAEATLYQTEIVETTGKGADFTGANLTGAIFERSESRP